MSRSTSVIPHLQLSSTRPHDKRDDPKYAKLKIKKYPFPSSFLAERCLYNILTSQSFRFLGICSCKTDFVASITRLLKDLLLKGYRRTRLCRKLRIILRHRLPKPLYHSTDSSALFLQIIYRLYK